LSGSANRSFERSASRRLANKFQLLTRLDPRVARHFEKIVDGALKELHMKRPLLLLIVAMTIACGGDSAPTAPSTPPPPAAPPPPTSYTLSGTVSSVAGGTIAGATITIKAG
jgi:hypothetical protein